MINHHTNALFFDSVEVPAENFIGEEGMGFPLYHRRLECRKDSRRSRSHRRRPVVLSNGPRSMPRSAFVFGRAIGSNQGLQFRSLKHTLTSKPRIWFVTRRRRNSTARKNAAQKPTWLRYLASEAAWEAANACLATHGGYGFAAEYDVERKFSETRLLTVAPVSNNLVLAIAGATCTGHAEILYCDNGR